MEKIIITFNPKSEGKAFYGWKVKQGNKEADSLAYDEMLALIVALTMPDERPSLNWMKTKEQNSKLK